VKPIVRSRLAEEVAATLADQIDRGRMSDELPSCRELAAGLGVSPPTVLAALKQLAAAGRLVAGKSRRPYRGDVARAPLDSRQGCVDHGADP
jgi:DNA-binding FadR family transcriptional regulator